MHKQFGSALVISLILLFVITLLGISAVQMTQMQEKMSSNLQDKMLAFNAAESALKAGEKWILDMAAEPIPAATCTVYPCVHQIYANVDFAAQTSSWWTANSAVYATNLKDVATPPRYLIEFLQFAVDTPVVGNSNGVKKGIYYYQVTSRGTGSTNNSISILQTVVARSF